MGSTMRILPLTRTARTPVPRADRRLRRPGRRPIRGEDRPSTNTHEYTNFCIVNSWQKFADGFQLLTRHGLLLYRQAKRLVNWNAVPFGGDGQFEHVGGGGGGVHGVDLRSQDSGLHTRSRNDPRDGHVFGITVAVGGVVPAVVGGDDDERFIAQAARVQFGEDQPQRLVRAEGDA